MRSADRPARKRPQQERSRELVGAVVRATIELLRGDLGDAFSMRKLAERAGVGVGSIYDYFADRDDVLDAVVDHLTRGNFATLMATFDRAADAPLEQALLSLLDKTFEIYLETGSVTRALVRVIVRFGRAEHVIAERDRFLEAVVARIAREQPGLDEAEVRFRIQATTDMVFGIVLAELHRTRDERRIDVARSIARRVLVAELERLRAPASKPEHLADRPDQTTGIAAGTASSGPNDRSAPEPRRTGA